MEIVLKQDHKLGTVKNIANYVKESVDKRNKNVFLPFVNERDTTGRLLPVSLQQTSIFTKEFNSKSKRILNKKVKNSTSVAFLSTKIKSKSRVSKKTNDSIPVGLYNPKSIYEIQSSARLPIYNEEKFSAKHMPKRSSSIDFIDIGEIHKKNSDRVPNIYLQKQIPRDKVKSSNTNFEKLLIPKLDLPEHLKKLKGLYHIGEFGKSDLIEISKDHHQIKQEISEKLNIHIGKIKEMGSFIKEYSMLNRWKTLNKN